MGATETPTNEPAVRACCTTEVMRLAIGIALLVGCTREAPPPPHGSCDPSLTLPAGFCAVVFADGLGAARHIAVAPNGDVFVARWATPKASGGLVRLRDTDRDGVADSVAEWTNSGGSGLALTRDAVYMSTWTTVLRYPLQEGALAEHVIPDSIVVGLPESGHAARSIVVSEDSTLFVNIGAPTNSCQLVDKAVGSPGRDPCPEHDAFAGIWRFDVRHRQQHQADGERVVSGVRHLVAFAQHPTNRALYGVQHGRDDLVEAFPTIYSRDAGAETPAEELFRLHPGADYGWPYCYYDARLRKKVLAPEYGGDGKTIGRCENAEQPIFAFPAHWAPDGMLFYTGSMFPPRYRDGMFVAFHGGWYRQPPDNGVLVAFLPMQGDAPGAAFDVFADGFAGGDKHPARAAHRPVGLAQGPDGALYITDDVRGRVWRVTYGRPDM